MPCAAGESPSDGAKKAKTTATPMITRAMITFALCDSRGRFFTGPGDLTSAVDDMLLIGSWSDSLPGHIIADQRNHSI